MIPVPTSFLVAREVYVVFDFIVRLSCDEACCVRKLRAESFRYLTLTPDVVGACDRPVISKQVHGLATESLEEPTTIQPGIDYVMETVDDFPVWVWVLNLFFPERTGEA